jgi:hypothetical protein
MWELGQERKTHIAKALDEKDDSKYNFQFTRIKQELERLQAQLREVKAATWHPVIFWCARPLKKC